MLEISDHETNQRTIETMKNGKTLLMFYTDWCPLCPPIIDILTRLEQEEHGKFNFVKINFDENPISVNVFHVIGVPMVFAIDNGKILKAWGGLVDEQAYREIIHNLLSKSGEKIPY